MQKQSNWLNSEEVQFSIDLIHDLHLNNENDFDWTDKHTSLYCVVAGNISSDLAVLKLTLEHLCQHYLGVLYIDGDEEHPDLNLYEARISEIKEICKQIPNCVYLHRHVVILNNIAFIGINGHVTRTARNSSESLFLLDECRDDDSKYLAYSIDVMQEHEEVSQIVIVSSSIPSKYLSYGELHPDTKLDVGPALTLIADKKKLVKTWLFGGYNTSIDMMQKNRRWVNNPNNCDPYWPKRIELK